MQIITELVDLIRSHQVTRLDIVGQPDSNGKLSEFYEALKSGKVRTDAEAAQFLAAPSANSAAYRKLKQRLKERLVNTLLFIDTQRPSFTRFQQAYYNSHRLWAAARVAMGRGARQTASDLSKTVLRQAIRYEFTDLAVLSARMLARNLADTHISQKTFEEYNQIVREQLTHFQNETIAEIYYNDIVRHFESRKSPQPEYLERISEYVEELRELRQQTNTYYFNILYYSLYVLQYESTNDIYRMTSASKEALAYFEQRDFAPSSSKIAFLSRIMYGSLIVGQYQDGLQAAQRMTAISEVGSLAWFLSRQPMITVYLHTKQYTTAYEVYTETVNHPRYRHLAAHQQEFYSIFSAGFYFLFQIGQLPTVERRIAQFRLRRFLNSVPIYHKDKRGLNVTVLLLQFLIHTSRGETDAALDRIEPLSNYRSRYLKGPLFDRTRSFIALLKELSRIGFRPKYLQAERTDVFLQRLAETRHNPEYHTELELIPYQDLWQLLTDWLSHPNS